MRKILYNWNASLDNLIEDFEEVIMNLINMGPPDEQAGCAPINS